MVRGDATQVSPEPETFDAALSSLVLSVIPTARDVVQTVHDALVPGGRFVVFDARVRYREGPMQLLNPLRTRFVRRAFNHQQQDVVGELRAVFERVELIETFRAGSEYISVAVKQSDPECKHPIKISSVADDLRCAEGITSEQGRKQRTGGRIPVAPNPFG